MKRAVKNLAIAIVTLLAVVSTQQVAAVPTLDLPNPVSMRTSWNGVVSLLNITVSGFPPGDYDISEGTYVGWCADLHADIDFKGNTLYYPVRLYSTYDPTIPVAPNPNPDPYYKPGNWNMINYMINQGDRYSPSAIQFATWYFMNGLSWGDISGTPGAQALVQEADLNRGFEPGPGEVMAVLCYYEGRQEDNVQDVFFEVPLPVPEASTLMLFGVGMSGLLFFVRKKGLIKF
jgi:hypothetical protein